MPTTEVQADSKAMPDAHTPGTWEIHIEKWCGVADCRYDHDRSLVVQRDAGVTIADCGVENNSFAKANARLIAAAPDLLEALRAALPILEDDAARMVAAIDGSQEDSEGKLDGATAWVDQARAAIAKAEGRTDA